MTYLIVENGIIENIIVAEPDAAAEFGALPFYDGARIGDPYDPPTLEKLQAQVEELSGVVDALLVASLEGGGERV